MPTYRYYTADINSRGVLMDLELQGVYMNKLINRAGQFNGTIELGDNAIINTHIVNATMPGKTLIYCERNGVIIWGGILWARTYSAQSEAFQLSAQTFESYFDHIALENHFIQQKVNQEIIFVNLVNQCLTQGYDMHFEFFALPTTNIPRTVLIPGYEFHFASEVVSQLVDTDLGLEYTIEVSATGTVDRPSNNIRLGYPKLGSLNNAMAYDYPGSIKNYWMPESAASAGTKFAALGYGSGNKVARATATDFNALAAGYPGWWIVNQYSSIADLSILQGKATEDSVKQGIPVQTPTFEIRPEAGPDFNAWNSLGDTFTVYIEDKRFPSGLKLQKRMIGWELTPQSSDSDESLKFTIEGGD